MASFFFLYFPTQRHLDARTVRIAMGIGHWTLLLKRCKISRELNDEKLKNDLHSNFRRPPDLPVLTVRRANTVPGSCNRLGKIQTWLKGNSKNVLIARV